MAKIVQRKSEMSLIRVTCYCKICNQHVCSYNNKWIKINDIYSTYEHPMSYLQTGLTSAGEPIERTEESGLAGLHTVAMACTVCGTPLGIKCVKAPERKIKYKYVNMQAKHVSLPSLS